MKNAVPSMRNRITGVILILGSLLMGLSIALPILATSDINVVGGADLPTFLFHIGKTAWMAVVGIIMIMVCLFIRHKK